jgi:hypothetical protein
LSADRKLFVKELFYTYLITYASGITALAAKRFRNLAAILVEPKYREDSSSKKKPAIDRFDVQVIFDKKWVPRPNAERGYTPANNYLFELLRPVLQDYLPQDAEYEETFGIFEYLLALTHMDIVEGASLFLGRFAWVYKRLGLEHSPLSEFVNTGLEQGNDWELLKAGFFNGSVDRFKEIEKNYKDRLHKVTEKWY